MADPNRTSACPMARVMLRQISQGQMQEACWQLYTHQKVKSLGSIGFCGTDQEIGDYLQGSSRQPSHEEHIGVQHDHEGRSLALHAMGPPESIIGPLQEEAVDDESHVEAGGRLDGSKAWDIRTFPVAQPSLEHYWHSEVTY